MPRIMPYLKRKLFKHSQARLEYQFQNKKWDWLESLDELPRYSALIGLHRFHNNGGSVLDLGCGQGILLKRFQVSDYSTYTAVDFSPEAIGQLVSNPKVSGVVADISTYQPQQAFDSIIFNESLYYLKNPLRELKRYLDFLTPNGYILVSIHLRKNGDLVNQVKSDFEVFDSNTVINKWGESWECLTIKKQNLI